MDAAHVHSLHARKLLTAKQLRTLLDLIDRGVVEPCREGATPAQCKLWYAHLPDMPQLGGAIEDVAHAVLTRGAQHPFHRRLSYKLRAHRRSAPLQRYLAEWRASVAALPPATASAVLEPVAWSWLDAIGVMDDDLAADGQEYPAHVVWADDAAADPTRLLHVLNAFRRVHPHGPRPWDVVDALALARDWWTRDTPTRVDALVLAKIDDGLGEHEWVRTCDLGIEGDVDAVLARLAPRVVRVGDVGVTLPGLWKTSCDVHQLLQTARDATPLDAVRDEAEKGETPSSPIARRALTDEQMAVATHVLQGHRVTLCCSPAGTGKTHMASALAEEFLRHNGGGRVVCLAPTHKALAVLRDKIPSECCEGGGGGGDDDDDDDGDGDVASSGTTFLTVQYLATVWRFFGRERIPKAALVLVDETSMLTMSQVRTVLLAYASTTRILFLGDDAQLPCIGRGCPIRDLQHVVPTWRLTRCMRTEGAMLVEAATAVRDRRPLPPPDDTATLVVHPSSDRDATIHAALVPFPSSPVPPWDPAYVQVITPQNNHADLINAEAQRRLTGVGRTFSGCYVGDAVQFCQNTDAYKNGDVGVVTHVSRATGGKGRGGRGGGGSNDGSRASRKRAGPGDTALGTAGADATVRMHDGTTRHVTLPHLRPAYASTVHRAQGSEYATVVLALFVHTHPNILSREMVYTSITRARHALRIVGHTPWLERLDAHPRRRTLMEWCAKSEA